MPLSYYQSTEHGVEEFEVEHNSMLITIEFEYTIHPGEKRTWNYPGSPAYVEVTDAHIKEIDGDHYSRTYKHHKQWLQPFCDWAYDRAVEGIENGELDPEPSDAY